MARYIDAEKIVFWIRHVSKDGLEDDVRKIAFSDEIARMPTADVAPRAEVDFLKKTIAENAQKALEVTLEESEKAKAEVAEKIFWEIDKLLTIVYTDDEDGRKFIGVDMQKYYSLKKKYTEGQK